VRAAAESPPPPYVFQGSGKDLRYMLGLTLNEEINEPEPTVAERPIPDPDFYMPPQLESPTEAPTEPLRACSPFADMDARQLVKLLLTMNLTPCRSVTGV